jgi:hypothetical protein
MPQGCGASVASAASPKKDKSQFFSNSLYSLETQNTEMCFMNKQAERRKRG